MKKRLLLILALVLSLTLIVGVLFSVANNHLKVAKEKKVMAGFETLMAREALSVAEVINYLDQYINTVSKENASKLLLGLERVQQAELTKWQKSYEDSVLQEKITRVYQDKWSRDEIEEIADQDLKRVLLETADNGFKVETAEGFYFPVIDYTFYEKYYSAVTPDLVAYLELMAVESEQTPVKDAALIIGWDEILNRAERQEEFIREYSSSTQVEPVQELLKRYVSFALFGCNNTPLFSYDTKQMRPEAKRAYEEHVWKEEKGNFSALINEYLSVLKENDYRLTAEVDAFRKKAVFP